MDSAPSLGILAVMLSMYVNYKSRRTKERIEIDVNRSISIEANRADGGIDSRIEAFFFCRFGVAGLLDGEEPKNNSSKKRMDYLKDKSKVGISDDQK